MTPPPFGLQNLLDSKSLKLIVSMTLHDRTTKSLLHLHKKKKPPSISAQFQVRERRLEADTPTPPCTARRHSERIDPLLASPFVLLLFSESQTLPGAAKHVLFSLFGLSCGFLLLGEPSVQACLGGGPMQSKMPCHEELAGKLKPQLAGNGSALYKNDPET